MNFNFKLACLLALASPLFAGGTPRKTISLDEGWRFHLGSSADLPLYENMPVAWQTVDLPHDYVVEGSFSEVNRFPFPGLKEGWFSLHGFLEVQPAVYSKDLTIADFEVGKQLWLEFDGVFSNSRYWLNGKEVGNQYSGYTRSRFDITHVAKLGKNSLIVQTDPRFDGWWYEGGGIYRHVRLVIADAVHLVPDGVFVAPVVTKQVDGLEGDADVIASAVVKNASAGPVKATLLSEVVDARRRVIASKKSECSIPSGSQISVKQELPLASAKLWSPAHPNLYDLRSSVLVGGKVVDQTDTAFGVREFHFDANRGFFINGEALKLKGINMHQDHAGVGVAMPDRLFLWRLERLKEMGCNAIRLSHNPVSPVLLDACDRMGFIVIAENRHLGDTFDDQTQKTTKAVEHRDLSALITRDRNHPSIILWSLCNEQWIQGSPEAAAMARAMKQRVHEIDPTRPVTAAMNGGFSEREGLLSVLDVIGINYHPEVYEPVHAQNPNGLIVATEIASEVGTRGVYADKRWENYTGDREKGYVSALSINAGPSGQVVEDAWPPVANNDFIAGGFVWSAFDYKGEPRPFEWPVINSHYGVMDICGFPKDSFYYYQAWWTDEPVLHLFPHWNWPGQEDQEISVWVHSNCSEVELFLNGVSQGKQVTKPYHHLEWKLKYAPGKLMAKGLYHGKDVVDLRETTGAPASLRLTADRAMLSADNADLAVIKVEALDAAGRPVPVANNKVKFTLRGPAKLIGVGNGDPSSHEPDKADTRSLFNGLAQAIVQTTHVGGDIVLTAESAGVTAANLTLTSR